MRARFGQRTWRASLGALLLLVVSLPLIRLGADAQTSPPPPTSNVRLDVLSARDSLLLPPNVDGTNGSDPCAPFRGMPLRNPNAGRPIFTPPCGTTQNPAPAAYDYEWLINDDNTGNPNQASPTTALNSDVCHPVTPTNPNGNSAFPAGCQWPSVHLSAASRVVSSGTQADWSSSKSLPVAADVNPATLGLKPGKYLVSVRSHGFEIGGTHFSVPATPNNTDGTFHLRVDLNPQPIPLGTIKVKVFKDEAPADGIFDAATEHGLAGFSASIVDFLGGRLTTDWYGNQLCTEYEKDTNGNVKLDSTGAPTRIAGTGGRCLSDADGIITIPNMGQNRYSITVAPPDSQKNWKQTTTLEGGHDWDFWMQSNDTGLDTELVQAGEPVPWAQFGFVDTTAPPTAIGPATTTGGIKGQVVGAEPYVPGIGGLAGQGGANGQSGIRNDGPLSRVWLVLNDLNNADSQAAVTETSDDQGHFNFQHIKDGDYSMGVWDEDQDYAFDIHNVTVRNGQVVDLQNVPLIGWFTKITGYVFVDQNGNGKRDAGEPGVPGFVMQMLNRDNNLEEGGQNLAPTDFKGYYAFKEAYPLGSFEVLQFFNNRYKTTGLTYQADNDPQEHTVLTSAVDISTLNIIGLNGRVDVGVQMYDSAAKEQGGIVATVTYDSTRNELAARQSVTEIYQPGIPNIPVHVGRPTPDPASADGYKHNPDGSIAMTPLNSATDLGGSPNPYVSESYERPSGCIPRDANGLPTTDQDAA